MNLSRLWCAVILGSLCVGSSVIGQPPGTPPTLPGTPPGTPPELNPPPKGGEGTPPKGGEGTPPPKPPEKPIEWPKQIYGKSVQDFINEFSNSDPTVRELALRTMPSFGPDVRKTYIKPAIKLISDPDPGVRIAAITLIGAMPIENRDDLRAAAEALRAAIQGTVSGSAIRLNAAKALAGMGPEAISVLPTVMNLSEDAWWETRQAAAAAIGRIGSPLYEFPPAPASGTTAPSNSPPKPPVLKRPASKAAVEKLLNTFLNDKSAAVRLQAAQSLIALGPPTNSNPQEYIKTVKPWLNILAEKLKTDNKSERDPTVRIWLMVVTIMYDDRSTDQNVERITAQLVDGDTSIKLNALGALSLLGPKAKNAMVEVRKLLHDKDPALVMGAIGAIMAQGEDAKYSISDFEKAIEAAKDPVLRDILRRGLSTIRQQAEPKKAPAPTKK